MRKLTDLEYKEVLLTILMKIDQLCRCNNLKYSLAYGTLLGAIRHKGFIPWDDDADIMMPRDDYEKLIQIINTSNCGLRFMTDENTDGYYFPFGKICDTRTILEEGGFKKIPGYGAYVDVFPMTRIPQNSTWQDYRKWKRKFLLVTYSNMNKYRLKNHSFRSYLKLCGYTLSKCLNTDRLLKKIVSTEKKLDVETSRNGGEFEYGLIWDFARFPKTIFENQIDADFESHIFKIPSEYDSVLNRSYGKYMELPAITERKPEHNLSCFYKDTNENKNN